MFWFLAREFPNYCSLPHAVALILSEDDQVLLDVISHNHFKAQVEKENLPAMKPLPRVHTAQQIQENYRRIHKEAQSILAESEKYQPQSAYLN